ncbi:pali-domain-containing protein [Sodiomyces alkalinus F11]|uniref:Pali-domain-containing protein n=1 Tax=Sodiomyces alkalinus (strain CBS 110278 / VKM F-3762 / F11) TaxID=1314773 RepID=A0A3N2Q4B4_SODAK|nr:pali-domain-containing protein [Sodiomyces alkalinus F11]ROT41556.1 pali-domain-containing protein [Sodiomyces alkalinus F11]
MGLLSFVSHFGTFLLLAATVLLVVSSITAPTVSNISLFTVDLGRGNEEITFGTFGWCVRGIPDRGCSSSSIGYSPTDIITAVEGTEFSDNRQNTAEALTNVMILHPIAAGISFLGFVLSLGSGMFGSLLASLVAGVAFLVTTIALICDFVWISAVRNNVNDDDSGGSPLSNAHYGAALWCVLVAALCALVASVILLVTCCSGRSKRRRTENRKSDFHAPPAHTGRRRWWSRRRH